MLKLSIFNPEKIIEWLLYLFVFLLPWQTRWIFADAPIQFQQMSLYGFDIILILLFGIILISKLKSRILKKFQNSKFKIQNLLPVTYYRSRITNFLRVTGYRLRAPNLLRVTSYGLLITFLCLSIIWSSDRSLAFYWSIRLLLAIGLIWALKKINFDFRKLAWVLIISITLQALIGIGQFITQDSLIATKWLGASSQEALTLGASVIETSEGRWLRAYGTQPHPNVLGGLLVIGILLNYYLFQRYNTNLQNPQPQISNPKQLQDSNFKFQNLLRVTGYWLLVTNLILVACLFFTFSRSAWLAIVIIASFWLIPEIKYFLPGSLSKLTPVRRSFNKGGTVNSASQRKQFIYNLNVCLTGVTLIALLVSIYLPLVQTRFSNIPRLEHKSITERAGQFSQAYELVKTNLILGVGVGNYTAVLRDKFPALKDWQIQPIHNFYLLILAELGLIGFLLLVFILKPLILDLRSIQNQSIKQTLAPLFGIIFIISLFDHYYWTLPSMFYLFWLTIGLSVNKNLKQSEG